MRDVKESCSDSEDVAAFDEVVDMYGLPEKALVDIYRSRVPWDGQFSSAYLTRGVLLRGLSKALSLSDFIAEVAALAGD